MTVTKTKQAAEFDLLDPEILQAVPDLQAEGGPGQPILDAARLFHRLQEDRKRIVRELSTCAGSGGFSPQLKFDAGQDAAALLDGAAIDTLIAPAEETKYGSLRRQLRAVEAALPAAQGRIGEAERKVVAEQCEVLRPIAQEFIQATLDAVANLLACLKTEQQFFDLLNRRGLSTTWRPRWMDLWPQQLAWLNGDVHRPSLERGIIDRTEAAGLGDGKKKVG